MEHQAGLRLLRGGGEKRGSVCALNQDLQQELIGEECADTRGKKKKRR